MQPIDIVYLIFLIVAIAFGAFAGFGRVLRLLSDGLTGKIASVVITYFLFGVVLNLGFVQKLMSSMVDALAAKGNWFFNVLLVLRIDMIALVVVLFIAVRLLQKLVVGILVGISQIQNPVVRVLNKVFGSVLAVASLLRYVLVIFQVVAWISGTNGAFYQKLVGGSFGLDNLYLNNPLNSIFETLKHSFGSLKG